MTWWHTLWDQVTHREHVRVGTALYCVNAQDREAEARYVHDVIGPALKRADQEARRESPGRHSLSPAWQSMQFTQLRMAWCESHWRRVAT